MNKIVFTLLLCTVSVNAAANIFDCAQAWVVQNPCCTLDCRHWYVGGQLGVSHLHDKETPNSNNYVNQNGPGWTVNTGYQVNRFWGGELGYVQYHDSRETFQQTNIAKTEHYAAYLAATGTLPIYCCFNVFAKLGVAYSYANKIFNLGFAASSGAVSPYLALGISYNLTKTVDILAEWSGVRGNNYTGSSELYSIGFKFAIV